MKIQVKYLVAAVICTLERQDLCFICVIVLHLW